MKSSTLVSISPVILFVVLALPTHMAAQSDTAKAPQHHHYKLIDVGTLGGPDGGLFDSQNQLTKSGTLVGWADTAVPNPHPDCFNFNFSPDCKVQHGFQYKNGVLTDLGALPGVNNSQAEATNEHGLIVGQSENGLFDPSLNIPATDVVAWFNGKIHNLGTLGGYQGVAFGVNNAGQVTGLATNNIPDQFSFVGGTQTRAFLWEGGPLLDLGTLGGPDAFGQFVNEGGQVAGFSYTNSTPGPPFGIPPLDPFIWDRTTGMRDLGNFGGNFCNPFNLNNRGEFVGSMNLPDQSMHAFLWNGKKTIDLGAFPGGSSEAHWVNESGDVAGFSFRADGSVRAVLWAHEDPKIRDLGAVDDDNCSTAWAMNEGGQIVGFSSSQEIGATGFCFDNVSTITAIRAALWENGTVVDLNSLVPPDTGVLLVIAKQVNDRGEIAVVGNPPGVPLDNDSNEAHGHDFLLIPCDENHPNVAGCDYTLVEDTVSPTLSNSTSASQTPAAAPRHIDFSSFMKRSLRARLLSSRP